MLWSGWVDGCISYGVGRGGWGWVGVGGSGYICYGMGRGEWVDGCMLWGG